MKLSILAMTALLLSLFAFTSCDKSSDIIGQDIENLLTEAEESDLIFLREEEKLARDVYLYLYDRYGKLIFKHISASEQAHMDAVLMLIEKYDLEDPAKGEPGIFSNESLQELYDELIQKGNLSLEDALLVGATIEDVDIRDLQNAIDNTSQEDIQQVYEKLLCGSKNHLRAFNGQLKDIGSSYTPQYIEQQLFDEILDGQHGHCG